MWHNSGRYSLTHDHVAQKLSNKEILKLSGGGDEEVDSDGEVKKKEKTPNMHRMMKNRLQKLIELQDDQ